MRWILDKMMRRKPEPQLYVGHISEAYCLDCDETYVGERSECFAWLKEHRAETGHRG